jgi:hypothetical protein
MISEPMNKSLPIMDIVQTPATRSIADLLRAGVAWMKDGPIG